MVFLREQRIINGQSVEVPGNNDLHFIVSHRFGAVNGGLYNFFGIDQGTTRLGLEYGIKDILSFSIGRSTYEKTYDGGIKVKVLRQQTGKRTYTHNDDIILCRDCYDNEMD